MKMVGSEVTAIILAGGAGKRMNSNIPKQYMELLGKPVLYYSLKAFQDSQVDSIVLVAGKDWTEFCKKEIVEKYNLDKVKAIVEGGAERYDSVKEGLKAAKNPDYVLIHDGARACVSNSIIEKSIEAVKQCGACTVGVPVKDTIKVVDENNIGIATPDRNALWQIQTPQSFEYRLIMDSYIQMETEGKEKITDDTMVVERFGNAKTKVIMGEYTNIKITTFEDLEITENFLKKVVDTQRVK
jgi:2-C-methyl-D-erythritol 4-phosphate cytidylyltransferase